MRRFAVILGALLALGVKADARELPPTSPPRFQSAPCEQPDLPVGSECGSVRVPENWSERSLRDIDLRIVRIPAQQSAGRSAVFIFQGGPGQGATKLGDFYERVYRPARKTHDIVLIDQRGTGGSNPLTCDFGGSANKPQGYFADLFEPAIMRRCRTTLEAKADLAQYTTQAAAKDAEAVRQALGYGALELYGTSYGSRLALEYARRYPQNVRTLTLKGVLSPRTIAPGAFAADVERSVNLMFRDCAAETACAASYPHLRTDLIKIIAQLNASPASVPIADSKHVTLTRQLFGATVRTMLQATSLRAELPKLINQAANGNWAPYVVRALELRKAAQSEVATGLMLSVLCAEDVPYLNVQNARQAAQGTVLGSYWVDQVVAACRVWPRGKAPAGWRKSFRVQAPTLLISGSLDPATPPAEAEATRRYLPRSLHLVAPGGSHSFTGMDGCVDVIMSAFISSGSFGALKTDCVAGIKSPPFKT